MVNVELPLTSVETKASVEMAELPEPAPAPAPVPKMVVDPRVLVRVSLPETEVARIASVVIALEEAEPVAEPPAPAPPEADPVAEVSVVVVEATVVVVTDPAPPVAEAQYWTPYAITVDATSAPQASVAQSRRPYMKFWFMQRHAAEAVGHPRDGAKASMLLTQV